MTNRGSRWVANESGRGDERSRDRAPISDNEPKFQGIFQSSPKNDGSRFSGRNQGGISENFKFVPQTGMENIFEMTSYLVGFNWANNDQDTAVKMG
jgi:hypothetical protein